MYDAVLKYSATEYYLGIVELPELRQNQRRSSKKDIEIMTNQKQLIGTKKKTAKRYSNKRVPQLDHLDFLACLLGNLPADTPHSGQSLIESTDKITPVSCRDAATTGLVTEEALDPGASSIHEMNADALRSIAEAQEKTE